MLASRGVLETRGADEPAAPPPTKGDLGAVRPAMLQGLTSAEAALRLAKHGPNELVRDRGPSAWALIAAQFQGAMVWLLLAACAISVGLGEIADATAIAAIIVLNAIVGFSQEFRAERALLALRAPRARVLRDGSSVLVPAADVVPGDVMLLEAGDIVAADATCATVAMRSPRRRTMCVPRAPTALQNAGPKVAPLRFLGSQ